MELLEGETLAARLRHEPLMSIPAAVAVVYSTGAAIAALHAKGIVHRDVKPSNIVLVRRDGHTFPKLLDLGAGKEVGAIEDVTAAGMIIGSPHYMAPEQASGRKDLDARVDQYALAVVAYQALTGSRPFENDDTGHVLAKVLAGVSCRPPRELRPEVPAELEAVILKAMSRAREDRYPSVEGFVMELRRTLDDARAVAASLLSTRELVAPLTVTPGAGGRIEAHEKTGPMAVVAKPDASRSGALPLVALAMVVAVVLAVVVVKFGLGDARPVVAAPPPRPSLTARPPPPSPVASTAPMVAADPSAVAAPVATPGAASSGNPVASSAPSSSSMELPANAPHDRPTPAPRPRPSVRPSPGETPCRPTPGSPCL
jgi:serine/threonine-protein kinase